MPAPLVESLLGLAKTDFAERAKCEREMEACVAAASVKCDEFAERCLKAFREARIASKDLNLMVNRREVAKLISWVCLKYEIGELVDILNPRKSWCDFRAQFEVTNLKNQVGLTERDNETSRRLIESIKIYRKSDPSYYQLCHCLRQGENPREGFFLLANLIEDQIGGMNGYADWFAQLFRQFNKTRILQDPLSVLVHSSSFRHLEPYPVLITVGLIIIVVMNIWGATKLFVRQRSA